MPCRARTPEAVAERKRSACPPCVLTVIFRAVPASTVRQLIVLTHRDDLVDLLQNPLLDALDARDVVPKLGQPVPLDVVLNDGGPRVPREAEQPSMRRCRSRGTPPEDVDTFQFTDRDRSHPPHRVEQGRYRKCSSVE